MTQGLFWAIPFLLLGSALAAPFLPRPRWIVSGCAALAGLLAIGVGTGIGFGVKVPSARLNTGLPFGPLTFGIDTLGAFFLVVFGIVTLAAAIYAGGYLDIHLKHASPRSVLFIFSLLLLSLVLIVIASDLITFLIAWESMAFLSYLAVSAGQDDAKPAFDGYLMLAISEFGTIGIIGALLFLERAGDGYTFSALRVGGAQLTPGLRDLVFLLALFGFGAKAGLLPLQLWLPGANAAAPGHIAAVLSGAIEGLGIYGMLRVIVDFLGPGPAWWGLVMLCLGAVTAFVGILHALTDRDLKRILAYSTIENDGLIVAAIGVALTFQAYRLLILAAITGLFAIYHLLNHAAYKSLLFLGASAVDQAAGSRDLERLGGLVRRMPWTAIAFLIGALSIAAVAPFSGYISEWGILEAMLHSFDVPSVPAKLIIAGAGALLALTAGLAITTFVRVYAVGFLAQPRSIEAENAREVPLSMRVGMGILAVACLGLGFLPAFVITALDRVNTPLWHVSVLNRVVPPLFTTHPGNYALLDTLGGRLFQGLPLNGLVIIASPRLNTITSPTYLVLAGLLLLAILFVTVRVIGHWSYGTRRIGPVWAGGIPFFAPRMQYGGLAYSNPARLIFNAIYRSRSELRPITAASRYGEGRIDYFQEVPEPLSVWLYRPIARGLDAIAGIGRIIQSGSVNRYVMYIFAMVILILVLRAI